MRRGVLCLALAALAVSGCSQGPGQVSERAQFVIEPLAPVSEARTVQDCGESCLLRTDRRESVRYRRVWFAGCLRFACLLRRGGAA
jgi:hypothetical protein